MRRWVAHHEKAVFLRKDNNAGKVRKKKAKKTNMRCIDFLKEAINMSLQVLLKIGHCGHYSFTELPGVKADSTEHNTHCCHPRNVFQLHPLGYFCNITLKSSPVC